MERGSGPVNCFVYPSEGMRNCNNYLSPYALCHLSDHRVTPNSARRFFAQALSFEAESTGISAPKLTV